jgi:serine/threonine protein kinase
MAQLASSIAALHESGFIHQDLKSANVMLAGDGNEKNPYTVKLIDLGCACPYPYTGTDRKIEDVVLPNYSCAPIEIYELSRKFNNARSKFKQNGKEIAELRAKMVSCATPAYDVYGLGMNILPMLFGKEGDEVLYDKIFNRLINRRDPHGDYTGNISARKELFNNAHKIVRICNRRLSSNQQYTDEQCTFIANAMKACLDPNPKKRPSAAQVAEIFELFAAGIDFGKTLELEWSELDATLESVRKASGTTTNLGKALELVRNDFRKALKLARENSGTAANFRKALESARKDFRKAIELAQKDLGITTDFRKALESSRENFIKALESARQDKNSPKITTKFSDALELVRQDRPNDRSPTDWKTPTPETKTESTNKT